MDSTNVALDQLTLILSRYSRLAVALSGGVDSTLLAMMAHRTLPGRVLAVTARTPLMSEREIRLTQTLSETLGMDHRWVDIDLLADPGVTANSPKRCYFCKLRLLGGLAEAAGTLGYSPLVHGANADDGGDYRPGQQAAHELGVDAPLAMAGMTKADVRAAARDLGLPNWNKPAMACLASRIPYGAPLSDPLLRQVEQAETLVLSLGATTCRVRVHGPVARIEAPIADHPLLMEPTVRDALVTGFRRIGFDHVSLDMEGLVSGSMNRSVATAGNGTDG